MVFGNCRLLLESTGREFLHVPLPHPLLRLGCKSSLTGWGVLRNGQFVDRRVNSGPTE